MHPPADIAGRHAAYRCLADLLRDDASLPAAVRRIRFFEAAARVTGPAALGMLQRRRRSVAFLTRAGWLDAGSRDCIEALNAWLLERNRAVAAGLARRRDGPGDTASGPASRFDDAMVVFEQREVEAFLARRPPSPAARRGIDRLLGLCAGRVLHRLLGIDPLLARAIRVQRRLDPARFSFFAIETRIGIGQRLVRDLHRSHATMAAPRRCR